MSEPFAIEVRNLTHRYGDRPALRGLEFSVQTGEIFGLLGPNGGGKTTLFRILSTLLPVQEGSVAVLGYDVRGSADAVRRRGESERGGRPDSAMARALDSLTFRPLGIGPPPDERWIIVGYRHGDDAPLREHRFDWRDARHDWEVMRVVADLAGRRVLAAVWRDVAPQRMREQQLQSALQQIEEHQAANLQLRREFGEQVMRDSATGLSTRAHFDDQLRREVDLSTREHREFALVLVELDVDSERVSALGSRAQDRVLEAMGRLLRGNTRAMDASCRLQARRFGVLLSGVGLATAHSRMEGLRRQCATQIVVLDGEELGFSVSMGVASFPHTAHSQDDLLNACESALSEARKRGGNTVALASIRFDAASA